MGYSALTVNFEMHLLRCSARRKLSHLPGNSLAFLDGLQGLALNSHQLADNAVDRKTGTNASRLYGQNNSP
jgi:hypothetical protein